MWGFEQRTFHIGSFNGAKLILAHLGTPYVYIRLQQICLSVPWSKTSKECQGLRNCKNQAN